ncbi:M24 family metallopeptidase [Pseudonocardia acaciae]|uniref:M24 family metallopeptidase n=1 Tax=Pseudonocardia acaciae TaxID=551276 RepID=UPI000688E449|nr:Xaa-Pro peptidase family protein [Pseudonocardia acaciae]
MNDGSRKPAFSVAEYRDRADRLRRRLAERDVDALLVIDPANINWLTGYESRSYYTPQAVLVTTEDPEPVWFGRDIDVPCATWTTHLPPDRIIGYPDTYVTDPGVHAFDFVAELITARLPARGRLAVETDALSFTPRGYRGLTDHLPSATVTDGTGIVNRLRAVKSDAELTYMRQAGQIAMRAMERATEVIRPGVRECDAMAEIYHALLTGLPEFGGDIPITPNIATGRQTDSPHLTWSDAPFAADTPVNLELAGCRHRYHSALSRGYVLGRPSPELVDTASVVLDGYLAAFDELRPGRECRDVAEAWTKATQGRGVTKDSRIGYTIGIGYPSGSWSERAASLFPNDRTPIEANMTFHVMLGVWTPNTGGYVFSETVLVTDDRPEPLTTAARELARLGT